MLTSILVDKTNKEANRIISIHQINLERKDEIFNPYRKSSMDPFFFIPLAEPDAEFYS